MSKLRAALCADRFAGFAALAGHEKPTNAETSTQRLRHAACDAQRLRLAFRDQFRKRTSNLH
jgi:hypothetical protein